MSRGRALSVAKPAAGSGLKDAAQRNAAVKAGDRAQRRSGKMARKVRNSIRFWAHINPKFYPQGRATARSGAPERWPAR
jgi:hypothetical protein